MTGGQETAIAKVRLLQQQRGGGPALWRPPSLRPPRPGACCPRACSCAALGVAPPPPAPALPFQPWPAALSRRPQIGKESRFSSAGAFAKAMLTDSHTYFIEAQPGTDLAFLAALCIAVDELFRDQEKK